MQCKQTHLPKYIELHKCSKQVISNELSFLKLSMSNTFWGFLLWTKQVNSKLFVTHKPWIKNIGHKTGAAEDKINLKHCHHLFFKKILKKFTKKLSKPGASLDIWIRLFSLEKKILKKLNSFGKSFSLIQTLNPEKFKSEQVLCSGGKLNFYQPDNSNKWRLRNNFWQNVQHYSNKLYI